VTDDRQTDHATEKCVKIGGIACLQEQFGLTITANKSKQRTRLEHATKQKYQQPNNYDNCRYYFQLMLN